MDSPILPQNYLDAIALRRDQEACAHRLERDDGVNRTLPAALIAAAIPVTNSSDTLF